LIGEIEPLKDENAGLIKELNERDAVYEEKINALKREFEDEYR